MDKRLQEIAENMEKWAIGPDEPFKFKCRACGKCCKNREDIMFTSRDLFNIARHLSKTPDEIIREYCNCYIGNDSRFPIVLLLPRGANKACPFLVGKRCRVHESKPTVCALFPIGRILAVKRDPKEGEEPEYEAGYILQPTECGSLTKINTVRQWLEKFGMSVNDEFYSEWNRLLMHVSMIIRELEETVPPKALLPLQNMLVELIYIQYDTGADFLPQFKKNALEAKSLASDISSRLLRTWESAEGDLHGE